MHTENAEQYTLHKQYGHILNNVQNTAPIHSDGTEKVIGRHIVEALRAARLPVQGCLGFNLFDVPRLFRESIVFWGAMLLHLPVVLPVTTCAIQVN